MRTLFIALGVVMVLVGMGSAVLLVALTVVMVAQKTGPGGQRVRVVAGLAVAVGAVVVLLR